MAIITSIWRWGGAGIDALRYQDGPVELADVHWKPCFGETMEISENDIIFMNALD